MATVNEHYETHLGPLYSWMAGGVDASIDRAASELDELAVKGGLGDVAVDLGCGFGMYAIPLARRGFSVLAIDSCAALLGQLQSARGALPVRTVQGDLLEFRRHLSAPAALVMCMGDTITHLGDVLSVARLINEVAHSLTPNGCFVISLRNYCGGRAGEKRSIPVRNDDDRALTCFLEYGDSTVTVHDILYEREASLWRRRASSYEKLRLSPQFLIDLLQAEGLSVRQEAGLAGMVRMVARRV